MTTEVCLWVDGEEWKFTDMLEAPAIGDIVYDAAECRYYRVFARQWNISPTAKPRLHVHLEEHEAT